MKQFSERKDKPVTCRVDWLIPKLSHIMATSNAFTTISSAVNTEIFLICQSSRAGIMNQDLNKRQKNYILMRSIRDYGMGILFICIGIFFFFFKKLTHSETELIDDVLMRYMLLVLFVIYGLFRIYRGYAKQYFRNDD